MATQIYNLTDTPTDVVTAVMPNLAAGTTYSARYVGNERTLLKVLESDMAPDANDPALPVRHFEDIGIVPVAGESVYVWTADGTGILVINEVA